MSRKNTFTILLLLILCIGCSPKYQSTIHNLDFEYNTIGTVPSVWSFSNPLYGGYEVVMDSQQKLHGKTSLRLMKVTSADRSEWGFFCQNLLTSMVAGREIVLTGWIKIKDAQDGFANLYIYNRDNSDVQGYMLDDPDGVAVRNTSDWTKVSVKRKIGDSVDYVTIGGVLKGDGTAWFDNLTLTVDGVQVQDTLLPPLKTRLTRQDKEELRRYVHSLRTYEPDGGRTDDLDVLERMIGNSKVAALGESTHGSSEVFKMKDRIIRYLAENMGFDIFSIEANMPESYRLNEYVKEGKGNPEELIGGMYFWTWNTQEMLSLVEWMRRFNTPEPRITYTGFDMQFHYGPLSVLEEAFRADTQERKLVETIESRIDSIKSLLQRNDMSSAQVLARETVHELNRLDNRIEESYYGEPQKEWLRRNNMLLRQYLGDDSRDRNMADNLLWIKRQNPASKIIVWAHNSHIQKGSENIIGMWMGDYLKDSLNDDYVAFGFAFFEGGYTATKNGKLGPYPAQQAYPGTLEYLLEQLEEPIFILDLKKMRADNASALDWIDDLQFRYVGASKEKNEFENAKITEDFDYLIFIRESTPSHILKGVHTNICYEP